MSIAQQIIDALNSDASFDNGLSNRDAKLDDDANATDFAQREGATIVTFTYPAPVLSGACVDTVAVRADGSIFDGMSQTAFATFDAWLADLESMMEV